MELSSPVKMFFICNFFVLLIFSSVVCQPGNGQDGLVSFIKRSFEEFGDFLSTGIYDLRVPKLDPAKVPRKLRFESKSNSSSMVGFVNNVVINGLSDLTVKDVDINVLERNLRMSFDVHSLQIRGNYNVEGKFQSIFPVNGSGKFVMSADDVVVMVTVKMKRNDEMRSLDVETFELSVEPRSYRQHFQNLLGGGNIGILANHFVDDLSKSIFSSLNTFLNRTFGEAIRRKLVQTLRKISINSRDRRSVHWQSKRENDQPTTQIVNDYFDSVLENALKIVAEKNLDPVAVPNLDSNTFTNGEISGLKTLHRQTDAVLHLIANHLTLEVDLGLDNVTTNYDWKKKLFFEVGGEAELKADHVSLHLEIGIDLKKKENKIKVRKIDITKMEGVDVNFTGLGVFSKPLSGLINFFARKFTLSFADFLEPPIVKILETSFNDVFANSNNLISDFHS